MALSRRSLLVGGGAVAGLAACTPLATPRNAASITADPFTLGVASGDPLPDGVVLWTRLAPRPLEGGGMPDRAVVVRYEVSTDEGFRSIVRRGAAAARPQFGHSVHVDVRGLRPSTWYWYRFRVDSWLSPVGRTRTAPGRRSSPAALAFAFASCQDWQDGYFTAYRDMAAQDLDFVVHLGDYIYEGGAKSPTSTSGPPERVHNSPEIFTLTDYRNRYALYRSDPDLRAAHARFPFIVTTDDHEVDNDYAGLLPENPALTAGFPARRAAAFQAYYEHLPIRERPSGPDLRLYRRLAFGDLLQLHVLDTRQYRTDQPCGVDLGNCAERTSPAATMTGDEQERWLLDGLQRSSYRWDALANQTIFAEIDFNTAPGSDLPNGTFNVDQWDGYAAARQRVADSLAQPGGARNPVVITGDFHASWVADVKQVFDDPASPTVATEFVGTSISSTFPAAVNAVLVGVAASPDNPHLLDVDGLRRGYVRCDLDRSRWTSTYRVVDSTLTPTSPASTRAVWVTEDGRPGALPG